MRQTIVGGIVVLALLLSGCRPAATPTAPSTPPTVRVAFFPNITHAAALYGSATGAFARALGSSARVEEQVFTAGPAEIEAVFAGEVDLGYIGPGPAVNGYLKSKGDALQIVAGAASGGAVLVARKGVAITKIAELAGKRVAVPQKGGSQDISLRWALKEAGLTPKDKGGTVEVLALAPADTVDFFRRGALDAAWVPEPWGARLEAELGATLVVDEVTLWPNKAFSSAVVIVRRAFLKEHPELVTKLLAAHRESVAAIQSDPDKALPQIATKLTALNKGKALPTPLLKKAISRTQITADPLPETILTFADRAKALGYLREGREALTGLFAEEKR